MTKKKIIWLVLILLIVGGLTYGVLHFFRASSKHLKRIPSTAYVVLKFDFKSMFEKLDYNGAFQNTKFFKKISKEAKQAKQDKSVQVIEAILKNPMSTGINVFSHTYLFNYDYESSNYTGFVADIRDMGNFNRTLAKISELKSMIQKTKDFYFIKFDETAVLTWNKEGLLFLAQTSSNYGNDNEKIEAIANDLMLQNDSNSIRNISEFESFKDRENDVDMFVNFNSIMNADPMIRKEMDEENLYELYKNTFASVSLNFLNDSMRIEYNLSGDIKQFEKISYLKTSGIQPLGLQLPSKTNPLSILSLNLNLDYIKQKLTNVLGNFDQGLFSNNIGKKKDWYAAAFDGEVVWTLLDVRKKTRMGYEYVLNKSSGEYLMEYKKVEKSEPIYGLFIGVKDNKKLDSLLALSQLETHLGRKCILISKEDSIYTYIARGKKCIYFCNNFKFTETMEKMMNKPVLPLTECYRPAAQKPIYFYSDMDLSHYPAILSEELATNIGKQGFKEFKNYISFLKSLEIKGDGKSGVLNLHLKTGEGNSLFRIFKQMDHLNIFK